MSPIDPRELVNEDASDFIVDLLVGSPHPDVRHMALEQFWLLSQTQVSAAGVGDASGGGGVGLQTPQQFLLNAIHTARLPFWVSSSSTRGSSLRYVAVTSSSTRGARGHS